MFSNRLAFVALAVACIAAAAGGGYLATRQNAVPTPASAQTATAAPAAAQPSPPAPAAASDVAPQPTATDAAPKPAASTKAAEAKSKSARPAPKPQPLKSTSSVAQAAPVETPPLDRPMQSAAQPPAPLPAAPAPKPDDRLTPEPAPLPEPPQKTFLEITVPAESVIGLQIDTAVSSDTARIEDRVEAHVIRDVRVNGQVAIAAGAKAIGSVSQVDRGGKFKERARLGVRFHTLVLADGTRLPINTETIIREGDEPEPAKKIGAGAVGGAILGAILGGAKGAAIGAAAGGGGGAAVQAAGQRSAATLAQGAALTVRIIAPVTVTLDR
jgi:hypothetical protein